MHPITRSLPGRGGEATIRPKPMNPTTASLALEPRGNGVHASIVAGLGLMAVLRMNECS